MFADALKSQAADIIARVKSKRLTLVTAESCTGGLIAALFTEIPGSSDVFERGFITYSNRAKIELLGVDARLIEEQGAVSEQVVAAMALGALARTQAGISVAVTGIAGPGGGSEKKPVGLVYIAVSTRETLNIEEYHFKGSRSEIRMQIVEKALTMISSAL